MINIDFVQQVLGSVVTIGTIIFGLVRKQSYSTIEKNAVEVIKFVDRHYADKDSEVKKLRFIYTVRNMIINKVPKGFKWLVKYVISDKNIEKILNLYFTNYKTQSKVSETVVNTQSLLSNSNSLVGTDVNIPNYDFEGLESKYKGNFYSEVNYRDNFKNDKEILAKMGLDIIETCDERVFTEV